jgi:hypothetical protein
MLSHVTPTHLLTTDPTVGIFNTTIGTMDGFLICSFSRLKKIANLSRYFDLNDPHFVLAAAGQVFQG